MGREGEVNAGGHAQPSFTSSGAPWVVAKLPTLLDLPSVALFAIWQKSRHHSTAEFGRESPSRAVLPKHKLIASLRKKAPPALFAKVCLATAFLDLGCWGVMRLG